MLISIKMRNEYSSIIEIPSGISCSIANGVFTASKGSAKVSRKMNLPYVTLTLTAKEIKLYSPKANKKVIACLHSAVAHIKNLFEGLNEKFVYELEICNVHFPMTVKVEPTRVSITNFLGEKVARIANIVDSVEVKVVGNKITITAHDLEKAGQTAANLEKASRVRNKDRRIFQDGIFITKKPMVVR